MKCDDTRFTKIVYNVLLADAERGKHNWVSMLKNVLQMFGFGHVWFFQGVENNTLFFNVFNQRVRDNYGQTMHSQLQDMSRGKHYILFFINAKYLDIVKTESHRTASCRLRSRVVNGISHTIPNAERKCIVCDDI